MNKELFSTKIKAGKRTYYLDVKESREGSKYISFSENKRLANGEYESHRVIIFEEDINNVLKVFINVLEEFPNKVISQPKSKMEQSKEKFKKAYLPWTDHDDRKLTELFCQGFKINEMSETLQRNSGAISSRINKLELKMKYK